MPAVNINRAPVASYVLRVTSRTDAVGFELHEVRTGAKRRFSSVEALAEFLRAFDRGETPRHEESETRKGTDE